LHTICPPVVQIVLGMLPGTIFTKFAPIAFHFLL
jgi:hypothetical protein